MIADLADDKIVALEDQLLHHIAEFNDGELAFAYQCKIFTRLQKLIMEGRMDVGKAMALAFSRIPGARHETIQTIFKNVSEANEHALRILQEMMEEDEEEFPDLDVEKDEEESDLDVMEEDEEEYQLLPELDEGTPERSTRYLKNRSTRYLKNRSTRWC
ncbi:hypothetical protein HK104_005615 [Borealophlyctis nickersoniae]|nr:hypothetical protein HK104_005615 [Borealophlyctis nickersoniae]